MNACAKAWGVASSHSDAFRFAADHMAYLHDELLHLAVPAFDVHTAWEILTTGACALNKEESRFSPWIWHHDGLCMALWLKICLLIVFLQFWVANS